MSYITTILTYNTYEVVKAYTGGEGIYLTAARVPDLILLDLGLPDIDGIEVLERIREWSNVPIIILSARHGEQDKIEAFDKGANDYVTKPFGIGELLARIRSAIRIHKRAASANSSSVFTNGGLTIDYSKHLVTVDGASVSLTPTEYKITVMLAQNAGRVLTHEHILRHVWGLHANEPQTLRVNVANIRRKLEVNPADPRYIITEVGVGYRMPEVPLSGNPTSEAPLPEDSTE